MPEELRITAPTYYGHRPQYEQEWGEPNALILARNTGDGLRVVLGTHDYDKRDAPDVQIERRPNGWLIFLHSDFGDPAGYVAILDNSQTYLLQDAYRGDDAIRVLEPGAELPELDS